MPVAFCIEQACANFALPKSLRCIEHKREHTNAWNQTKRNPAHTKFYNGRTWARLREQQLNANPVCQQPPCTQAATDVDHIIAMEDGGPWTDMDNLQSLCRSCHAVKTAQEQKARVKHRNGASK